MQPAPAPELSEELSEELPQEALDFLRSYSSKYYEEKTLKDAAIDYNIETSARGSNKRKLAGQDELFQRAGATGEIYAQAGGMIIKLRNPVGQESAGSRGHGVTGSLLVCKKRVAA